MAMIQTNDIHECVTIVTPHHTSTPAEPRFLVLRAVPRKGELVRCGMVFQRPSGRWGVAAFPVYPDGTRGAVATTVRGTKSILANMDAAVARLVALAM